MPWRGWAGIPLPAVSTFGLSPTSTYTHAQLWVFKCLLYSSEECYEVPLIGVVGVVWCCDVGHLMLPCFIGITVYWDCCRPRTSQRNPQTLCNSKNPPAGSEVVLQCNWLFQHLVLIGDFFLNEPYQGCQLFKWDIKYCSCKVVILWLGNEYSLFSFLFDIFMFFLTMLILRCWF